jgi:hypothetical protein
MSPHKLSNKDLNLLIDLIKTRKSGSYIDATLGHPDDLRIHELFAQHAHFDYSDFVYLGYSLTPSMYQSTLFQLNKYDSRWLKLRQDGEYEDPKAINNIQGFLERAQYFEKNMQSKESDEGQAFRDGYLLQLLASPDRSAKEQAEQFRAMEFKFLGLANTFYRNTYAKTIINSGQAIEQNAPSNDPRVKRFVQQLDIFTRLVGNKVPDFKSLQVVLMSAGFPESNSHPVVEEAILSLGRAFLTRISETSPEERKDWYQSLIQNPAGSLYFIIQQARGFALDDSVNKRLYRSVFLTITNANKRCGGDGVNNLVELLKPNLNWPAMIKMLDDFGMKVLTTHVTDRDSYMKLIPGKAKGKVLEDELGL